MYSIQAVMICKFLINRMNLLLNAFSFCGHDICACKLCFIEILWGLHLFFLLNKSLPAMLIATTRQEDHNLKESNQKAGSSTSEQYVGRSFIDEEKIL